ncbi:hypothetical protein [Leptospira kmetyi]|uniref:DUF4935 domain-containing protein n=1 Tax=Leptospira kmetyi TaxID=408139 RepID=A0ABX4NDT4_9LEPT|nr:hypothetical protein [Leptospira kmetyi]PJZ29630.1 hypothetical protein CH378_11805 [Leptospira kmetyi]
MKLIYLDQNVYSDFLLPSVSDKKLLLLLKRKIEQKKILIPYSFSHITEVSGRTNKESISKELALISVLSNDLLIQIYADKAFLSKLEPITAFTNVKANPVKFPQEFIKVLKINERLMPYLKKMGFDPEVFNNKTAEEIRKFYDDLFIQPDNLLKKLDKREERRISLYSKLSFKLLNKFAISQLNSALLAAIEVKSAYVEFTRNFINEKQDIPDLFSSMIKPQYKEDLKRYRNSIKILQKKLSELLSKNIFEVQDLKPLSNYSDLRNLIQSSFDHLEHARPQILVSDLVLLELVGYYPDSKKRKSEVKKKGYFLELYDKEHVNYASFCDVLITSDNKLRKRALAALKLNSNIQTNILDKAEAIEYFESL